MVTGVEYSVLEEMWEKVLQDVKASLGEGCFQSWFSNAYPKSFSEGTLTLQTDQRLVRDRLASQYSKDLLALCQKCLPGVNSIDIVLVSDFSSHRKKELADKDSKKKNTSSSCRSLNSVFSDQKEENEERDIEGSSLDRRFTFENFIVGKSNEFAYAAALQVANNMTPTFNPLFLYGGVGLGKTHLMHATAWQIQQKTPQRKVLYLSAEQFMYQFIRSLRLKNTIEFKERFRAVDVLMIDDFQFIGGKETTQEEFFHTFNTLIDNKKQIIISADKSPSDLENIGDRLKSRLGWGVVADIHPTTYELRVGILQSKVALLDVKVGQNVIDYLAAKITSNVRELEGALNRIVAHASLVGCAITVDSIKDVLRDLIRSNEKYITIEEIQKRTCDFFGVKLQDLLSGKRLKILVRPRQMAMYLCKILTTKSLPEIGKEFGGRDHTTVLHAVRKIMQAKEEDPSVARDLDVLIAILER